MQRRLEAATCLPRLPSAPHDRNVPRDFMKCSETRYVRLTCEADAGWHPRPAQLWPALLVLSVVGLCATWLSRSAADETTFDEAGWRRVDLPTMAASAPRVLNVTLRVEPGVWRLPRGIRLLTRLYNGVAPGPTLHASPGDTLRILIQNRLGPDTPCANDAIHVGFRAANTTNLHLHGIHDSAEHDDTFARVHPGEERLYEYSLHRQAGSSLIW